MLAEKKAEMNARKRGNCHRKKAERQAASISMETTGVASITNQTNVCAVVVDTSGVASVVNQPNGSNIVVDTLEDLDDSWLRRHNSFARTVIEDISTPCTLPEVSDKDREKANK
ncbi:uncharacterized protein LOC112872990 [Panicum hallii]|uniref:uncharacterized protein LOC112872990 n=1 Tax=Panicum hallii TaxID=206008 RepID=UPI000DF4EDB6|nr:uncharacterized protein LOC112872990 [Panicum hallii]